MPDWKTAYDIRGVIAISGPAFFCFLFFSRARGVHSRLRATIGSTLAARRAGM
jgi:hypothetical protein